MNPGSKFNWIDNSAIQKYTEETITSVSTPPIFFALFSADKGPEKLGQWNGDTFFKQFGYGSMTDFTRHGQPLLQAQRIINAGGTIFGKRLVATDATLANIIIVYSVHSSSEAVTNAEGAPLYVTTSGEQTTEAEGNTPLTKTIANIKIETYQVDDATTIDDVETYAASLLDTEGTKKEEVTTYTYPLMIIADNGRGVSNKRVKVVADYATSKNLEFEFYTLTDIENSETIDTCRFAAAPDTIYNGSYVSYDAAQHSQFTFGSVPGAMKAYIEKINEILGIEDFSTYDILNCTTRKGKEVSDLVLDPESVDITYDGGMALQGGSNGKFGTAPFGTTEWETVANDFLTEDGQTADNKIYDLDIYKPSFVFDANYPLTTKNKITEVFDFRKDAFFFRDLGIGLTTRVQIEAASNNLTASKFAADYCTSYRVSDPHSARPIEVTMPYSLIMPLIDAFQTGINKPVAGIVNGYAITEYIKGTINYMPTITPTVNEKDILEELRVNYATYSTENDFVVETEFTSQEEYTQLSYINNVLAIQEVARAVRTYCPVIRYTLQEGSDFTDYKNDIDDRVISNYSDNFAQLDFVYSQDDVQAANKIFSADLSFRFNNFVQTEIFNLYAEL